MLPGPSLSRERAGAGSHAENSFDPTLGEPRDLVEADLARGALAAADHARGTPD
jgi:hypothetical protein